MTYALARYNLDDDYIDEIPLDMTETEVRTAFGITPEDYAGYCFLLTPDLIAWFSCRCPGASLDLSRFDYFVEGYG